MKKVAILSVMMIMLAVMVSPAMADNGNSNGQGNGGSAGQGNNGGNGNQDKKQDRAQGRDQTQDRLRESHGSSNNHANQELRRMHTPFYLQGTISAIDDTLKTVTVTLVHGNARVKQFIGTDLLLTTTDTTQIYQIIQNDQSDTGRVPITFEQLEVGQKVAMHGNLVENVYTVRLITVYIKNPVEPPEDVEP
ncbi:MAG: hypothetical protein A2Y88_05520 [Chloroflexi bacterium RBG_13_48_10]|nr:MAG: hypothetical protein A2Y88_05520 [Chloroflexi bacterium RBG_13_48_10]